MALDESALAMIRRRSGNQNTLEVLASGAEVVSTGTTTVALKTNSASTVVADNGGPRPKLILKRTGEAGDTAPTPGFAPLGDVEWHTVHDNGTTYTAARIWVDEESADPVVNVGRMRIGVHNGDATTYGETTYLHLTGYGDVDLSGGNVAVNGSASLAFNSADGGVSFNVETDVTFLGKGYAVFTDANFPFPPRGFRIPLTGLSAQRTYTPVNVDGVLGVKVGVPATATSSGVVGTWAADDTNLYICTATNTWRRVAIASW